MKLPTVHFDILGPIIEEIDGKEEHWIKNIIARLLESQPVLTAYLAEQDNEEAALVGLLIYRFLESQCEADEMEEMFG
ncbi:MAG: hypothetical protein V3V68_05050 [Nitrosomonadaceae bacterium]